MALGDSLAGANSLVQLDVPAAARGCMAILLQMLLSLFLWDDPKLPSLFWAQLPGNIQPPSRLSELSLHAGVRGAEWREPDTVIYLSCKHDHILNLISVFWMPP